MARTAEVFVNLPAKRLNHSFTYLVPDELSHVGPGWRVLVPFGRRKAEGFVVSVAEDAAAAEELKPLLGRVDDAPWFTEHMLAVAAWVSEYYLSTPAEAMRLFVPGKAGIRSATVYRATDKDAAGFLAGRAPLYGQVYAALRAGARTLAQLTGELGGGAAAALRVLVRQGLAAGEAVARRTAATRYRTYWRLAVDEAAAAAFLDRLKGRRAQGRMVAALLAKGRLGPEELKELKVSAATVKALEAAGLVAAERAAVVRDSYAGAGGDGQAPVPTAEQRAALEAIVPAVEERRFASFLLHGVTGSGKTQVYIEAAAAARRGGRQVVVLVPEIALTGQIVTRFKDRFGDDVAVLHSKLSLGERYDAWQRLRSGAAGIVIGARSAVFAPLPDPGLFIIDEEQEFTYKQEESPRYHTREVARKRAELAGAAVVLGSASRRWSLITTRWPAVTGC
jgi:primosomal protein N' (replication factor Y)